MEIMGQCVYLALCSVLLLSLGAPKAEGCSCEGAHPQQHFCRASYVIGARVLKRDYVRKNPKGFGSSTGLLGSDHAAIEPLGERTRPYPATGLHRLPDERLDEGLGEGGRQYQDFEPLPYPDGLQPPALPEGAESYQNDGLLGPIPQSDGLQPLPQGLEPLPQPDGLQPLPQEDGLLPIDDGGLEPMGKPEGLLPLPHPEGLQPLPEGSHPHEALPPLPLPEDLKPVEDTVTTFTMPPQDSLMADTSDATTTLPAQETPSNDSVLVEPTIANIEPTTQEQRRIDPESMEAWNYKIIYTLKLGHIYKTGIEEEGWKLGDEVEIESSAASSLCGRTDLKTGKNYLITGSMPNRVVLCDWVQEHHRLTSRQKQGLKTIYGKSCDVCQIHSCPSSRHCKKPKENRATTCLYDASQVRIGGAYSPYDCVASHSRCTIRQGHKCKWQKNNDYHNCMKHQLP